jgi:hypothetical protein
LARDARWLPNDRAEIFGAGLSQRIWIGFRTARKKAQGKFPWAWAGKPKPSVNE